MVEGGTYGYFIFDNFGVVPQRHLWATSSGLARFAIVPIFSASIPPTSENRPIRKIVGKEEGEKGDGWKGEGRLRNMPILRCLSECVVTSEYLVKLGDFLILT